MKKGFRDFTSGNLAARCLLVFPMKKVDKGDRGVAGGELEDGPSASRVPPGKQLTDGERLNRTRDHLAPLSAQIQYKYKMQVQCKYKYKYKYKYNNKYKIQLTGDYLPPVNHRTGLFIIRQYYLQIVNKYNTNAQYCEWNTIFDSVFFTEKKQTN